MKVPLSEGMWKGRRAFIIGGGGSLHGFDFNVLQGELTIGINAGFSLNPTVGFIYDLRLIRCWSATTSGRSTGGTRSG